MDIAGARSGPQDHVGDLGVNRQLHYKGPREIIHVAAVAGLANIRRIGVLVVAVGRDARRRFFGVVLGVEVAVGYINLGFSFGIAVAVAVGGDGVVYAFASGWVARIGRGAVVVRAILHVIVIARPGAAFIHIAHVRIGRATRDPRKRECFAAGDGVAEVERAGVAVVAGALIVATTHNRIECIDRTGIVIVACGIDANVMQARESTLTIAVVPTLRAVVSARTHRLTVLAATGANAIAAHTESAVLADGTTVVIVATQTFRLELNTTQPVRRFADAGIGAFVFGRARLRVAPDALTEQAGVNLGAGVAVVARGGV